MTVKKLKPEIEPDGYGPAQDIERAVDKYINKKLKLDQWLAKSGKFNGCIGECYAIKKNGLPGYYSAYLSIWDNDFNDSNLMAKWFLEAGATFVLTVSAVLYDGIDGDRNGKAIDGGRQWIIKFQVKDVIRGTG